MAVLAEGVPNAVKVYPGPILHQTFCSGNKGNENIALLEPLLSWGKPDCKQRMEIYFCKDNDKHYKNYNVTVS